jgi:hypothetical protein
LKSFPFFVANITGIRFSSHGSHDTTDLLNKLLGVASRI